MSQRDCGWIQLYAETNQEATDLHVQAFRIAEQLSLPVMVCMDGFILTHAYERIDLPTPEQVDSFLLPFAPRQVLDPADPVTIGAMVGPEAFTEVKYLAHAKQLQALDLIPEVAAEFATVFGRESGGLTGTYRAEDAETIVVALGSVLGTIEDTIDELREEGMSIGALAIKSFRPFPMEEVRAALAGAVAVRGAGEGAGGRGRRHRLGQRADGALGHPAARLHGDRRPWRAADHEALAALLLRRRDDQRPQAALGAQHGRCRGDAGLAHATLAGVEQDRGQFPSDCLPCLSATASMVPAAALRGPISIRVAPVTLTKVCRSIRRASRRRRPATCGHAARGAAEGGGKASGRRRNHGDSGLPAHH